MGEKLYARSATLYNNKYIPVRNFRRRTLRELNHCVYTIPEEIWGLLVVYVFCPFLSFTERNWWTCLNSICTLSSGSQILKHLLNYRPFYLFYLFFFLESRTSQLMSQYGKLLSGVSAIYHSNFTLWPLGNVILKQWKPHNSIVRDRV